MEVSSIGFCEGRVGNIMYNFCILTNLKSDHIDYHKNIKNYHQSKLNLIKNHKLDKSIIFLQDDKLKKKLLGFKNNLFTQGNFLSKNKVSIVQKNYDRFQISVKNNL